MSLIEELGADIDAQPVPLMDLAIFHQKKEIEKYLVKKKQEKRAMNILKMVI